MRDKIVSFRTEASTARAITWLVNNYNLEHVASASKTDLMEGLITLALEDSELLNKAMKKGIRDYEQGGARKN